MEKQHISILCIWHNIDTNSGTQNLELYVSRVYRFIVFWCHKPWRYLLWCYKSQTAIPSIFSILLSFFRIFDLAASLRIPSPCVECLLRVKSFESWEQIISNAAEYINILNYWVQLLKGLWYLRNFKVYSNIRHKTKTLQLHDTRQLIRAPLRG